TITGKNTKAPYTYAFGAGPFSSTNVFSGLYSGAYSVSVKDSNSCVLDTLVVLPDSVRVTATALLTNILCNGDSTGVITLNAAGATAPYRYQRVGAGPLSPVNTFGNLRAVTHNFHIEDTNKCYLDTAITLTQPTKVGSNISVANVLCFGDSTGSITINGNGGIPPYMYAIGGGIYNTATIFSPLAAGTYTLHVKDANNCIRDTAVVVTEPTELIFDSVLVTNLKCYGVPGGEVSVHGAGGISPYMYAVNSSSFSTSRVFNGLSASTYIFHVRDSNNCVRDTAVTLVQPQRIVPAAAIKRSSCSPLNDGTITMSATGGAPGYRYALGSGSYSTNAVFSPLAAGNYVVHVRDVNNCIIDTNIVMTDSLIVSANISVQDALCYDSSSGIIITLGSGGAVPYT
ncbi:MAG: SprB repeat-containing protein, partial [Taibaiella sp.]|nr:SprB repeat-containing protein [Taibaiella sp.]